MSLPERLIDSGVVTQEQLDQAIAYQEQIGGELGYLIVKLGIADEKAVLDALAEEFQMPAEMIVEADINPKLIAKFPRKVLLRGRGAAIPLREQSGELVVGLTNPEDFPAIDAIRLQAGCMIETVLVPPRTTREILQKHLPPEEEDDAPPARSVKHKTPSLASRSERGRKRMHTLVQDLEAESKDKADKDLSPAEALKRLQTLDSRALLLGLIDVLAAQRVIDSRELLTAARKAAGESE